jgi:LacI family transcriptional regulator
LQSLKKKISIHDIAKELNVSATTISFVLNGKAEEKRISEDVKKNVLDYVKQVGYHPNQIAKSLRTGKTHIIVMLVEDISDPFFSSIARSVESIANKHHYKIFFASTVVIDNFYGGYQAVKHLEENGHDPIVKKLPYKPSHDLTTEKLVQQFIEQHSNLDAIMDLGKTIPDDIAVVGFDDNTHFHLFSPSITVIAQPIQEIPEEIVRQIMAALSNKEELKKQKTVTLPVKLIVRNSSKAGAKKKRPELELTS